MTRTTPRIRALALAGVVLAMLAGTVGSRAARATAAPLAPGSDFSITTSITSSPTSADAPALLYPGVTRYLWYTVHNPMTEAITVTSIGLADVQAPPQCSITNLDLDALGLTGAFVVPAGSSATVLAPRPLQLLNLPFNQDSCKDATFTFSFTGTGWYSSTTPQEPKGPQDPPPPTDPGTQLLGSATLLTAGPSPAALGAMVTLTARVTRTAATTSSAAGPAVPAGAVSFHLRTPNGADRLLGTIPLDAQGVATLRLTDLPPGSGRLFATYAGTAEFAGSTSQLVDQAVIAPPSACPGSYATSILGRPDSPVITGTTGNDFIYAVGGDYRIKAGKGNDCIVLGDGTNTVSDGSGADVVLGGHGRTRLRLTGSRNTVILGDGQGNRITVVGTKKAKRFRYSSDNHISLGDGPGNRVTIRKGNRNVVTVGSGSSNRITIRKGNRNVVTTGDGARNRVRVGPGTRNRVLLGNGARNRVSLSGKRSAVTLGIGAGTRVRTTKPGLRSTCSLPKPPSTWRGSLTGYYKAKLLRCRVVLR